MANPNRQAFKKTYKKLAASTSEPQFMRNLKKADIVKYDYTNMGSNHGQKMAKRANQGRVADGIRPVPVYQAGDAEARRAEQLHYSLNPEQFSRGVSPKKLK